MFLKSLKLKNFKIYIDKYFEFNEGLIAIIGRNGSGKSSIFEAILTAFYGLAKKEFLLSSNANSSAKVEIELEFIFEKFIYKIVRIYSGKRLLADAKIYKNSKLIESKTTSVNRYISNLLGMSKEAFLNTVFTTQKELSSLSNMNVDERKKIIRKLLGFEKLDYIEKELKNSTKKRVLQTQIEELKSYLIDEIQINRDLKFLLKELKELNKKLQNLEDNKLDFTEDIKNLSEEVKKLNEYREKLNSLKYEINILKEKLDNIKFNLNEKELELKELNFKKSELNLSIRDEFNKTQNLRDELIKKVSEEEGNIKTLTRQIVGLKKLGKNSTCPTCEQILPNFNDIIDSLNDKILIHNQNIENLNLKETQEKLNELKPKYENMLKISELIKKIPKLKDNILKLKSEKVINLSLLESKKIELEESVYDEDLHKKILTDLEKKQEERDKLLKENSLIKDELNKNRVKKEIFEDKLNNNNKLKDNIKQKEQNLDDYKKIIEAIKSFKVEINSTVSPKISQEASKIFSFATKNLYQNLRVDNDFNFFIEDEKDEYPIERYSGGEIDLANFALRVAISKVSNYINSDKKISILAFDEIFGSQDEIRREEIIEILNNLLKEYSQIFVITHIEDVKESFENILELNLNPTLVEK